MVRDHNESVLEIVRPFSVMTAPSWYCWHWRHCEQRHPVLGIIYFMVLQKIILVKNLLILMETCWALLAVLANWPLPPDYCFYQH